MVMRTKINIDDFLNLVYWVRTFYLIEGRPFNYQNLVDQAETYKMKNTPLDIEIHPIDNLMIDAFHIYHKLKETEDKVKDVMDNVQLPFFIDREMLMNETKKYERIFEDLMENCKFEDPEIRGIQKGFLGDKMKEYKRTADHASKLGDSLRGKPWSEARRLAFLRNKENDSTV